MGNANLRANDRLAIEYTQTQALTAFENNSRTHSTQQVNQIIASIEEFGFTNPILIDEQSTIIAGHGRLQAAEALGLDQVPTITLKGLTEAQRRAYVIADNKLALNAGWDFGLLESELLFLRHEDIDLSLLGFNEKEVADLLGGSLPIDLSDFNDIAETEMAHKCPRCNFEFD